jgi:hypothetical protein
MRQFVMLAAALLLTGAATPAPSGPVLVELFTSQGCSSCPPADAFLEELAKVAGVVAISRPVTYWDQLGWKDTLAREANTTRQRAYAARGGVGSGVYTPQMMIAGGSAFVGSDRNNVNRAIDAAGASGVGIATRPGIVALSGGKGTGEVWLVSMKREAVVRIGRGENGSRTIRYVNVLRDEVKLGDWKGGTLVLRTAMAGNPPAGSDVQAVYVQEPRQGVVIAARYF